MIQTWVDAWMRIIHCDGHGDICSPRPKKRS
jgi:hypothetical protein